MTSWIYDYVDGTLENVKHGIIGVEVIKFDDYIRVWKKSSGADYFSVDIPMQNIIGIQHYVTGEKEKTNKLLYGTVGALTLGGLMFTPLGPALAGAKLMSLGFAASKFALGFARNVSL